MFEQQALDVARDAGRCRDGIAVAVGLDDVGIARLALAIGEIGDIGLVQARLEPFGALDEAGRRLVGETQQVGAQVGVEIGEVERRRLGVDLRDVQRAAAQRASVSPRLFLGQERCL